MLDPGSVLHRVGRSSGCRRSGWIRHAIRFVLDAISFGLDAIRFCLDAISFGLDAIRFGLVATWVHPEPEPYSSPQARSFGAWRLEPSIEANPIGRRRVPFVHVGAPQSTFTEVQVDGPAPPFRRTAPTHTIPLRNRAI